MKLPQPYLPQVYIDSDNDATNCYMLFQRLAFKADLINTVVASQYGLPESLNGIISDQLVGVCDVSTDSDFNLRKMTQVHLLM